MEVKQQDYLIPTDEIKSVFFFENTRLHVNFSTSHVLSFCPEASPRANIMNMTCLQPEINKFTIFHPVLPEGKQACCYSISLTPAFHRNTLLQLFRLLSSPLHAGQGAQSRDQGGHHQRHLPAREDRKPQRPADHLPERLQHPQHVHLPRKRQGRFRNGEKIGFLK